MKRIFGVILLLYFSVHVFSQNKYDSISSILQERGEAYVSFYDNRYKSFADYAQLPGFDNVQNGKSFLYVVEENLPFIRENIGAISIENIPSMIYDYKMADSKEEVLNGEAYPGYLLYLEVMKYFQDSFPDICTIDTIGYSVNNRLILSAHLGKNLQNKEARAMVFLSSSMHGDETLGFSLMLSLINDLLTRNEEIDIDQLLQSVSVCICPLVNPDGTYYSSNETVFGSRRSNYNGVDINRNYPDAELGNHPDSREWQAETIAMMKYMKKIHPNLSANFHGGAEVVNYPFDTFSKLHPDDDWWRMVASEYVDNARKVKPDYMSAFPGGITNGFDWYKTNGSQQDYVCYFLRGRESTIELFEVKTTPELLLQEYWSINQNSLIKYIKQAEFGVHGVVTDSATGEYVQALIEIPDHDYLNSEVYSDSANGYFVRYLKAGNYSFKISAPGYDDYYLNDVSIRDYSRETFYIKLKSELRSDVIISNPVTDFVQIFMKSEQETEMKMKIYSMKAGLIFEEDFLIHEGRNEIKVQSPSYQGVYIMKLIFPDHQESYRILRL